MRFPKNAVYAKAKQLDARVEWNEVGRIFNVRVQAPRGFHWVDGCVHELVEVTVRPQQAQDRDDLWIAILKRMEVGLEACDLNDQACADNAF